jgi:hypothetical protein
MSTEARPASLAAPDADTDESLPMCSSSDALFDAQPDRVDANHSPDSFSAYVPNLLTEFVFFFFYYLAYLMVACSTS